MVPVLPPAALLLVLLGAPLAVALAVLAVPARAPRWVFLTPWLLLTLAELALTVALTLARGRAVGPSGYSFELARRWIPGLGVGFHLGADGLSLPLLVLTALLFAVVAVHATQQGSPAHGRRRAHLKAWVVLMLGLETTCLGVFVALDLVLFFVFFDLAIVLMYFVIAGWGAGRRSVTGSTPTGELDPSGPARAALLFFLYTFVGSLVMLLGFLGLAVSGARPVTFDIPTLAAAAAPAGLAGALVLAAVAVGLAIKIPAVPFHSWLPPAHTDAPSAASVILAGVLLTMGAYGLVRVAMPLLPGAWRSGAVVIVAVGAASVLWAALVALAQRDLKRLVAYTSVTHMGYVVLALGAAGVVAAGEQARVLAVTGALTQMVSHGLVTAALFLLAGTLRDRAGTSQIAQWSGLAGPMPRFAIALTLAAFAALGLPGFSGFVAEFGILAGALPGGGAVTVLTAVSALGIALTAALFLRTLSHLLLGPVRTPPGMPEVRDLRAAEVLAVAPLLLASLAIGLWPSPVTSIVEPGARVLVALVAR